MKKVITLVMIMVMTLMLTGCGEKAYKQLKEQKDE